MERLGEVEQQICQAVAAGTPLMQMLETLEISYATIRRHRDEAFSQIVESLHETSAA